MKKTCITAGAIVLAFAIIGGIVVLNIGNLFPPEEEAAITSDETIKAVSLFIDQGQGSPLVLNGEFKEGMTAFDLLNEKTGELNLNLETKTYDIGVMIEAIGDKKNGQDQKYWLYYVNGEMPEVAADKKLIKVGDKVEFKFETSPF